MYDGVLIARLNADVALTDFEIAVRDLVSNVESDAAHAVGGDEYLEGGPLVTAEKAVERLRILPDVVVDVQEGAGGRFQLGQGAGRDGHQVADTAHLEEHLAVGAPLQHVAP